MSIAAVDRGQGRSVLASVLGLAIVLALLLWFAGWTGEAQVHRGIDALLVLATSLPWVAGWLAAAAGFGWPLRAGLALNSKHGARLQIALGVAAMLLFDTTLGRLGLLQWGGAGGAWALLLLGVALLGTQIALRSRSVPHRFPRVHWMTWCASPAIAVLLLAACSAPGWLWASEFGGYDAMSYHLQLPKEWLTLGRIVALPHNVYSHLPGSVEAAYYHLDVLIGDGIAAVYACQFLHAAITLITAWLLAGVATRWFNPGQRAPLLGALAAAMYLGTPWVTVVGSLAYNDMGAGMMLTGGLLVLDEAQSNPLRRAAMIGVLAGTACGAKLTSIGFVAIPLVVLLLATLPARRWPVALATTAGAAMCMLLPWLVSNWLTTGNPVFPFATSLLGSGHWTAEQAIAFTRGHLPDLSVADRLVETWNQLLRYGIGPNPYVDASEPWRPQWSVLPWLAILGFVVGICDRRHRRRAALLGLVVALQLTFWLLMTHLKSRFMLPAVVPASLLAVGGLASLLDRAGPKRLVMAMITIAMLVWCSLPVFIFHREVDGAPALRVGMAEMIAGDGISEMHARELAAAREIHLNRLLPASARILLIGDAAPFYYRANVSYQTTWDRGPLSAAMRAQPDEPAAWLAALRAAGFTHVLVDPAMLQRWERPGWNDPLLTTDRVTSAAERYATVEQRFPGGATLYRLDGRAISTPRGP